MDRTRKALADAIRPFGPNGKLRATDVPYIDALADALGVPDDQSGVAPKVPSTPPLQGKMQPSEAAFKLIEVFEGLHDLQADGSVAAYRCPAGVWTIGYGATGPGIFAGTVWTKDQCEGRLQSDVAEFAAGVEQCLDGSPTTQHQFDALVSFAFNVGLGALARSTVLKMHKAGKYAAAARAFAMWNKGGGRILGGLVSRRAAEAKLYSTP